MVKVFGVPAFGWAGLCLVLSVVWIFVWPAGQAAGAEGFLWFALRWGHSLTWLFLGAAATAAALGAPVAAQRIALLALPCYAAFLYATVTTG
ncbi:hypothetical protein [Actinoplanes sp. CA-252034]|uniref:hypothetical protein n=1 Tax=Actinoplanes sp. CA-252034 TaxID=3239906 RepID=UPI003D97D5D2